uniref:Uncharacterized protein n=1 Tax=Siphoviridae sp. ctx254 TaxID=2825737 RepID=A0A8S5TVR5_9CAUD|nr:MAG TPA: hypothetical protein [Siphoviridae sp. ctx254]
MFDVFFLCPLFKFVPTFFWVKSCQKREILF